MRDISPIRLAFACYVFTSDARLLLTMRGHAKKTWPGMWSNSCYGHPAPGESLIDAVSRRLTGELGLPGVHSDLVLPTVRHRLPAVDGRTADELCLVYRVITDEPPHPDPGAVGDFEWVAWADFVYSVTAGDIAVSPWCRQQVRELRALGPDPARWPAVGQAVSAA
jgi:isopentenyl-diphosphate Delta-isomerase